MNNREKDIDIIKGLTICFVFLGHAIQFSNIESFIDNPFWKLIYSFHMPLFAFLSGMFFLDSAKRKTFSAFLRKKSIRLILPCITWVTITSIIYTIYELIINHQNLSRIKEYWNFLIYLETFWFLTSIFLCQIYTYLILKISKNKVIRVILLSIFIILPFRGHTIFIYPFFIMGILFTYYNGLFNKYRNIIFLISIIGFIICFSFWKGEYTCYFTPAKYLGVRNLELYWDNIFIGTERFFIGLFGSISFILLVKLFFHESTQNKLCSFLTILGNKTLELYIIQHYTLELIFSSFNLNFPIEVSLLFSILLTMVEIPIALVLISIIEKYKITSFLFFGKQIQRIN